MAENVYLNNRLKYHTASRVGIQDGQSMLQATNPDGHIVTKSQIWTAESTEFPYNTGSNKTTSDGTAATKNLAAVFARAGIEKVTWSWDEIKNQYSKIVEKVEITDGTDAEVLAQLEDNGVYESSAYPAARLYWHKELSSVEYSNDQSYECLMYSGARAMDWIAPTAVKDNGLPVPGYTGFAEAYIGNAWKPMEDQSGWDFGAGNWEFVYMSGLLTLNASHKLAAKSASKVRYTGFQYIGKTLDKTLDTISNATMAIKPFEWSANGDNPDMALVSADEGVDVSGITVPKGARYITLNAVVFNVFSKHAGIAYGDLYYLSGNNAGKTLVVFEDWDDEFFKTGVDAENKNMYGNYYAARFVAYGFVQADESLLPILSLKQISQAPV